MVGILTKRGTEVSALDMFSGFGGSSAGIEQAGAELRLAANHNAHAIDVHSTNFPGADHVVADLLDREESTYRDPQDLPAVEYLWASPSCKHHSKANSQKLVRRKRTPSLFDEIEASEKEDPARYAESEGSRVSMSCVLRYAAKHRPAIIGVENVVEAAQWGAKTDRHRGGDGSTFRWWLNEWTKLGYEYECVFLNAMFFDVPQSRDRMFVCLWRKDVPRPDLSHRLDVDCGTCGPSTATQFWKPRKPSWPIERWGKYESQYWYGCMGCGQRVEPSRRGAIEIIDWSRLGTRIADRKDPLRPNTLARILRGLNAHIDWPVIQLPAAGNTHERPGQVRARSVLDPLPAQLGTLQTALAAPPLMIHMRGGGSKSKGYSVVTEPLAAFSAGGLHHGLATAAWAKFNGGPADTAWHSPNDPLNSICGRDSTGMIALHMPNNHSDGGGSDRTRHALEPLATITGSRERYNVSSLHIGRPWTLDDVAEMVHYRMLDAVTEIKPGMGVADDFEVFGTKTQIAQGLGNMVVPQCSEWVTGRLLASL